MAICINDTGICFGSYSITCAPTGICISGALSHKGTQVNFSQAQGLTCGYAGAGQQPLSVKWNNKFPFATNTPIAATNVGDFFGIHYYAAGAASSTDGYNIGGYIVNYTPAPIGPFVGNSTAIEKFPFASDTNGAHVSVLSTGVRDNSGHSSPTSGYSVGGWTSGFSTTTDVIDKFPFASDSDGGTDVGELAQSATSRQGSTSTLAGYIAGQNTGPPVFAVSGAIQKFPFATDSGSAQTGTLTAGRYLGGGNNSYTHGYAVGGRNPAPIDFNTIDKYAFASDSNATDVGELNNAAIRQTPSNSDTDGYVINGLCLNSPLVYLNKNTRFPFAADAPSSEIGQMSTPALAACFWCGQGGTGNIQV